MKGNTRAINKQLFQDHVLGGNVDSRFSSSRLLETSRYFPGVKLKGR